MMNEEMIAKAKEAKSVEELIALAKENGVELDEESAKAYFDRLHPKTGEVSDDELENVSGGGCHTGDGRLVVTIQHQCEHYQCRRCGKNDFSIWDIEYMEHHCPEAGNLPFICECKQCKHMSYEKGLWLCNHPANRK